jgi:polyketide synthase 12
VPGDGAPPKAAGERRYTVAADAAGPADRAEPAPFLGGLYAQAARMGQAPQLMRLVQGLAAFRPAFTGPGELGGIPRPVPVCHGPAAPGLVCLPSFVGGPQEYARFAAGFRGIRPVSVIPAPGFAAGEPLPASVAALIAVHAQNIRACADGTPFVLAGHSTGGLVAHALAAHLHEAGLPPAAVVLLDTYPPARTEMSDMILSTLPRVVLADSGQPDDAGEDAWLTAMAHYFCLDWTAMSRTDLPTLLVRAQQARGGSAAPEFSWTLSRRLTVIDVPGDHFTMMSEHAATTAEAVTGWLATL